MPSSSQPLPRETGKDIGMGSPVPLAAETVGLVPRMRNMKVGILPTLCFPYLLFIWGRTRTKTGRGGAMSFSRQRVDYTQRVCPNKSYLPKIGVNEVDPPGPRPTPRQRPRLRRRRKPKPTPLRRPLLCSRRKRHSRSSIPTQSRNARKTRFCAWRLRPTHRRRTGGRSRPRRRSRYGRRTTARCIAGSVICRCIRIRPGRGCIYFCMRCGIRLVLGFLRRRCRSGLQRGGGGNVHPEDGSLADLICMVIIIQYIISVLQLHAYLIHSENS